MSTVCHRLSFAIREDKGSLRDKTDIPFTNIILYVMYYIR